MCRNPLEWCECHAIFAPDFLLQLSILTELTLAVSTHEEILELKKKKKKTVTLENGTVFRAKFSLAAIFLRCYQLEVITLIFPLRMMFVWNISTQMFFYFWTDFDIFLFTHNSDLWLMGGIGLVEKNGDTAENTKLNKLIEAGKDVPMIAYILTTCASENLKDCSFIQSIGRMGLQ